MSEPYIGEIRIAGFNFAPTNWAFCNGQLIAISQNTALFQLIGTTYGGDGQNTFQLPNLQSRVPVHIGSGFVLGQIAGEETVTLTTQQIPTHTHPAQASSSGSSNNPGGNYWAGWTGSQYSDQGVNAQMNPGVMSSVGNNQPHTNLQPYLAINFIIALFGVFPSQS